MAEEPKTQPSGLARWTPSLPTNLMSMLNPFSDDEDADNSDKDSQDANASSHQTNKKQSLLSSILPNISTNPASSGPASPEKESNSIMFAEPETRSNSEYDGSREGSIVDETGRRRSKKANKPKTCFSICHPAPASTTRQRFHRRPRSLLQLHKLSPSTRPQPAFEVIPSANFSVRLTKAITQVFKTKHGLCPNDLVVLRAEKYSVEEQDEEQEAQHIIALICKGRKDDNVGPAGKARICLPEGREWEAYPMSNGGYEFFSTDEHGLGLKMRWVPKRSKDAGKPGESEKRKFNFSTISPNSRRHPVIATLSRTGFDINDTYKMPEPVGTTPLSTPKQNSTLLQDVMEEEGGGQLQCETDDQLRQIIVMTGIWVAFKEGWSPTFKYDEKEKEVSGVQRSPSLQNSPSKSSAVVGSPVSTPPGSPALEKRSSIKSVGSNILRRSSLLGKASNRASTTSVPEEPEGTTEAEAPRKTGRARADSNSTVLVHRAASNRRKNNLAAWRPDLLSSQQEASTEDVSRKNSPSPAANGVDYEASSPPTHRRRASATRPMLPPAHQSLEDTSDRATTPRAVEQAQEKRESSSTTDTGTSASEAPRKPAKASTTIKVKKRKGGWRRLLCGGGQDI